MQSSSLSFFALAFSLTSVLASDLSPQELIEQWRKRPAMCDRVSLVELLRHEDVRVRSASLDLIEEVTGEDFGLDTWLEPKDVPAEITARIDAWAALERTLGEAKTPPTPEQISAAIALLGRADPDTLRRTCIRFADFAPLVISALEAEILENKNLEPRELANLRRAQFRLQLNPSLGDEAGVIADKLCSGARKYIIEGLEMLREKDRHALPVINCFVAAEDELVRELAIDLLLYRGKQAAFDYMLPQLEKEDDRNVMLALVRRAPDAQATPDMLQFLMRCINSGDEDLVVSALEAIGHMSFGSMSQGGPAIVIRDGQQLPTNSSNKPAVELLKEAGMTQELLMKLLASPEWRVRAAVLDLLANRKIQLELNAALINLVYEYLMDEDVTVQQQAFNVVLARTLVDGKEARLEEFAMTEPRFAPMVIYVFTKRRFNLSPPLVSLLTRFSPEQVETLFAYEEEQDSLITHQNPSGQAQMVADTLFKNPDPKVQQILIAHLGMRLWNTPQSLDMVIDWLQNERVSIDDKAAMLRKSLNSFEGGRLPLFRVKPEDELWPYRQKIVDLMVPLCEDPETVGCAIDMVMGIDHERAVEMLTASLDLLQRYPDAYSYRMDSLMENLPADKLKGIVKLGPESSLSNMVFNRVLSKNIPEEWMEEAEMQTAIWRHLMVQGDWWTHGFNDFPWMPRLINAIASSKDIDIDVQRYLAAVGALFPNVATSEAMQALLARTDLGNADYIACIQEIPRRVQDIEPWAQKFHKSKDVYVRRMVASCLLPYAGWRVVMPASKKGADVQLFPTPLGSGRHTANRVSCPASLVKTIRSMQDDSDTFVALLAASSVLYRVGDCDRERLSVLVGRIQDMSEKDSMNSERNQMLQQVNQVWYRWSGYRAGVDEAFKLKNKPDLQPGQAASLFELQTIANATWVTRDEIREQINAVDPAAAKPKEGPNAIPNPRAQQFYDRPGASHMSFVAQKPGEKIAEEEAEDEGDDMEEEAAVATSSPEPSINPADLEKPAPFRIEYFEKEGCDDCAKASALIDSLRSTYPQMEVRTYRITSSEGQERNAALCDRFNVASRDRQKAPALFTELGHLLGENIHSGSHLRDLLVQVDQKARYDAARAIARGETGTPAEAGQTKPQPQEPSALAETTEAEREQHQGEQSKKSIKAYLMLAFGGLVFLGVILLMIFGRKKAQ